jgi:NAD(P)-dependent dehydrogenase (short-subunit alcohol dehydrogenase family)
MRTAERVRALGRHAIAIGADVSKEEEVNDMVRQVIQEFDRIDILVNSAGILGPIGLMADNDTKYWIRTIETNLIGTFLCCKAVLPFMIKQHKGKIINLSGGGAAYPRPRFSAYSASKAAVVRLTETLAEELKEFNIQVNAIAPGAVITRMIEQVLAAGQDAGEKELAEAKRLKETGGTPTEIPTELAVFLASDDSNGLTGRLISAVWDDWRQMTRQISSIMATDMYTLRRINPPKK